MIDFNRLRPVTIGFDDIFDTMEAIVGQPIAKTQYPPYDIVKIDDYKFSLQLAVAGFSKDDIDVQYSNNELTIESKVKFKSAKESAEEDDKVIHKGISKRQFRKKFTVADNVVVNDAELRDGLLVIELEKILPESKKPRTIEIK